MKATESRSKMMKAVWVVNLGRCHASLSLALGGSYDTWCGVQGGIWERQVPSSFTNTVGCPPQHTQQQSTSAPCRRRQLFTWQRAGDTWTASGSCSRRGPSLTLPTSPEKHHSTKVRPPVGFPEEASRN